MSPASPAANSPDAGTGQTWFKVWEDAPTFDTSTRQLTFPSTSKSRIWPLRFFTPDTWLLGMTEFTFTIPPSLPSGQYLVRGEQVSEPRCPHTCCLTIRIGESCAYTCGRSLSTWHLPTEVPNSTSAAHKLTSSTVGAARPALWFPSPACTPE